MNKENLLLFLQDIVEQDGMFTYLRIQYTEYRPYSLEILKEIIVKGINTNLLEISKDIKKGKWIYLELDNAIETVNDTDSWYLETNIYEVTFIDTSKYIGILFNAEEPKIPEEFLEFIID